MKTILFRKPLALLLALCLTVTISYTPVSADTGTQTSPDTITVTLKAEDITRTLISTQITLSKEDITTINNTYTVESGGTETPVLTSENYTAAHALGKYMMEISETPARDLLFSYGSPSYIKGEESLDCFPYWSFRVNHESPADEATGFSYTPDTCPIKDGDCIVFFRQACYDPDAGEWGAYTNYSWFDKDQYEAAVNTPVTVTYAKDDGFGLNKAPAAKETLSIYQAETLVETATTDENGKAVLTLPQAGTYTLTAGRHKNGAPELSHASAVLVVTDAAATDSPSPSPTAPAIEQPTPPAVEQPTPPAVEQPTPPAVAQQTPPAIIQQTAAPGSSVSSAAPSAKPAEKPAVPKKLKASVKKKTVRLSWNKVSGADGYELVLSHKNKKKFTSFARTKKTTLKKKCKKGISYIKIRSYQKNNGKTYYSKYSQAVRVVIK